MYKVKLQANHLPKIREAGHMKDTKGTLRHPDRTMDRISVFFYVKQGAIHVFENENEYRIQAGGYLFLRTIHRIGEAIFIHPAPNGTIFIFMPNLP